MLRSQHLGDGSHVTCVCVCVCACVWSVWLTGGRRWLRVLCQAPAGDAVLSAELLRRVRQRGSDDECWWDTYVFFPGTHTQLALAICCLMSIITVWLGGRVVKTSDLRIAVEGSRSPLGHDIAWLFISNCYTLFTILYFYSVSYLRICTLSELWTILWLSFIMGVTDWLGRGVDRPRGRVD